MSDDKKHRPSSKHALDEVLQALQDLVHNELGDAQAIPREDPQRRPSAPKAKTEEASSAGPPVLTQVVQPASKTTKAPDQAHKPEQKTIDWDAIPVLQEVVAPASAPERTAKVTVQQIARETIVALERKWREDGQRPLDPAMIRRLEGLLAAVLQARLSQDRGK